MKNYANTVRALQLLLFSLPIGARLFKPTDLRLLPPGGAANPFAMTPVLLIVGLLSILPVFVHSSKVLKVLGWATAVMAIVAGITYSLNVQNTILTIPISSQHREVYRSIGSVRTAFANKYYPQDTSDLDMLMSQGLDEGAIERLWTHSSIVQSRDILLLAYAGFFSLLNFALGCFAQIITKGDSHTSATASGTQLTPRI